MIRMTMMTIIMTDGQTLRRSGYRAERTDV